MNELEHHLMTHAFLAGLLPAYVQLVASCATRVQFRVGELLIREGEREDTLYLILQGTIAIEVTRPGAAPICVETIAAGDLLGVAQLTPATAHLDCRARETVAAIAIDNAALHRLMDADPQFGYAITARMLVRTYHRLARARLQQLDVYR